MTDRSAGSMAATEEEDAFTSSVLELPGMDRLVAARAVEQPASDAVARAQAMVHAAVERVTRETASAELDDSPAAAAPLRRRLLRRRWIATAATVAAVATGAAVLPAVSVGGHRPAATADAATFLNGVANQVDDAAAKDGGQSNKALRGARYWKETTEDFSELLNDLPDNKPRTTTTFTDMRTGDGVWVQNGSANRFEVTNRSHPTWRIGTKDYRLNQLDHLPTDAAAMRKLLTDGVSASRAFDSAVYLLHTPITSEVRSAIFRAMAGIPGVHLDGSGMDTRGRSGVKVSDSDGVARTQALINPQSGSLLQVSQWFVRKEPDYYVGELIGRHTILFLGPSRSIPRTDTAHPTGTARPAE